MYLEIGKSQWILTWEGEVVNVQRSAVVRDSGLDIVTVSLGRNLDPLTPEVGFGDVNFPDRPEGD